jgi:hypothetical protein
VEKSHFQLMCLAETEEVNNYLMGFEGPPMGCFVANHARESVNEDKGIAIVVVKVQQGLAFHIDACLLKMCLGKTFPWKWQWQAKERAQGIFLVYFSK